jgi:serine/threonine protein phosphatase 1
MNLEPEVQPTSEVDELTTERSVSGELVYAVGDVHGRYDLLKALLGRVWGDCAQRAMGRTPVLILCGDFIDRGPQSAEVLDTLNWLARRTDIRLHLLKGNHEQAMLEFLQQPERSGKWLEFGGAETLMSYGVAAPARGGSGGEGLVRARDALLDQLPASHMLLLQRLQMMVTIGDYAFVHAGVRPGTPLANQAQSDLLWIREGFVDFEGPHERYIVHGHSWVSEHPQLLSNRLGLDTGAYSTGVLTAVRLEDHKLALLQARDGEG